MLRKLIAFAITSGLAKKAFDKLVQAQRSGRVADAKWRPTTPAAAGRPRNPSPRT